MSKVLDIVAGVFIAIALYVSAIVIAGCVATVIAGHSQQIATLRLLGAYAKGLRRRVVREVGITALLGSITGAAVGMAVADLGRMYLVHRGTFPEAGYPLVSGLVIPAVIALVLVAALAGYTGSQRMLTVSPAAAMSGNTRQETRKASRARAVLRHPDGPDRRRPPGARLLLVLGCSLGEQGSSTALFIAFLGGALFMLGLITGAPFVLPRCVDILGHLLGAGPDARIARRNAVADPMRTTRATLGLVIGVGLVTTFTSGSAALSESIKGWALSARDRATALDVMHMTSIIMMALVVIQRPVRSACCAPWASPSSRSAAW